MNDDCYKLNKGQVVAFSEGLYSDYRIIGHVRALVECDLLELSEKFLNSQPPRKEYDFIDQSEFIAFLIAENVIEPIDDEIKIIHLGLYKFEGL